ncbi:hypothetical protein BDD12DRAFT_804599 [Trichophaea hybrida]|nr:hypothetical protein BDD12DRAFT_804599 [Trichophaea hybrida]
MANSTRSSSVSDLRVRHGESLARFQWIGGAYRRLFAFYFQACEMQPRVNVTNERPRVTTHNRTHQPEEAPPTLPAPLLVVVEEVVVVAVAEVSLVIDSTTELASLIAELIAERADEAAAEAPDSALLATAVMREPAEEAAEEAFSAAVVVAAAAEEAAAAADEDAEARADEAAASSQGFRGLLGNWKLQGGAWQLCVLLDGSYGSYGSYGGYGGGKVNIRCYGGPPGWGTLLQYIKVCALLAGLGVNGDRGQAKSENC